MTDRAGPLLGDEVFDAVIRARADAPFPGQFKIEESVGRDDVAAADSGLLDQEPILDRPTLAGKAGFLESAPALGSDAIEQQSPAFSLFGIREGIVNGGFGAFGGKQWRGILGG